MNTNDEENKANQLEEHANNRNLKSTTVSVSTLVSGLNNFVGSAVVTANPGIVTTCIASPQQMQVNSAAKLTSVVSNPIIVGNAIQPMLLPKPNIQQTQLIPTTPPKATYVTNQSSLLNSPLRPSTTADTWNPSSPYNRKRTLQDADIESIESKRRRTPNRLNSEKSGKGLRHFSTKVCEKVQKKGVTTYNEVADELVKEFSDQTTKNDTEQSYDQKNIRRRVYDALNVLKAMNIITNEKKEIRWVGLPTNSVQECKHLEDQKSERSKRICQKMQQLKELIVQQIAFKNLVERNKQSERDNGSPPINACIHLPFIIVNTSKKTVIDCSISSDKTEYLFNFDEAFEIHDDIEVLKRLGLSFGLEKGECSEKDLLNARKMVPKVLEPYVVQMAKGIYGNPELIEIEGSDTSFAPLTFPQDEANSTGQPSCSTSTISNNIPSNRHQYLLVSKTRPSSALSAASDYDSENEADDERTMIQPS